MLPPQHHLDNGDKPLVSDPASVLGGLVPNRPEQTPHPPVAEAGKFCPPPNLAGGPTGQPQVEQIHGDTPDRSSEMPPEAIESLVHVRM